MFSIISSWSLLNTSLIKTFSLDPPLALITSKVHRLLLFVSCSSTVCSKSSGITGELTTEKHSDTPTALWESFGKKQLLIQHLKIFLKSDKNIKVSLAYVWILFS